MKETRLPADWVRAWQNGLAPVETAQRPDFDGDRRCAAIADKIRREHKRSLRQRRLRSLAYAGLAAAAAVALGSGLNRALVVPSPSPRSVDKGSIDEPSAPKTRAASVSQTTEVLSAAMGSQSTAMGSRSAPRSLQQGEVSAIRAGDLVRTAADGAAKVEIGRATRIELGPRTALALLEDSPTVQELDLRRGRIVVSVQKGAAMADPTGLRLAVTTPHARIVVRGTIFSVEVEPTSEADPPFDGANPSRTHVSVQEGVVAVTSGENTWSLTAGQRLSMGPGELPSAATTPLVDNRPGAATHDAGTTGAERRSPAMSGHGARKASSHGEGPAATDATGQPVAATTREDVSPRALAIQNRAFERGLRARDRGDWTTALETFRAIARDYPSSPVAESARLEIEAIERSHRR